jgi:twitching motility protein PilT
LKYLHKHKKSNVNQREIGIDTESVASGLKHVIRQGQDVIVIGDLNDTESITAALNAATSGCLVIAAINASNSVAALDRILKVFPDNQQPKIRMQLADTLLLLLSQRLVPAKEGDDKICAYEVLMNSSRILNLIKDGLTTNIRQLMQATSEDMSSIDQSIAKLCLDGKIEFDTGLKLSDNPVYYQEIIRRGKV